MPRRTSGALSLTDIFEQMARTIERLEEEVERAADAILALQGRVATLEARAAALDDPPAPTYPSSSDVISE